MEILSLQPFYLHCRINSRAKLLHLCKGRQNMCVAALKYNVEYPHSSSYSDCRLRSKHHRITTTSYLFMYIFSIESSALVDTLFHHTGILNMLPLNGCTICSTEIMHQQARYMMHYLPTAYLFLALFL